MRLNKQEAMDLLYFIDGESERLAQGSTHRSKPGAAPSHGGDVVGILNAWVRQTDRAAKANAGFMTLLNASTEDVNLVKIESDSFDKIEMHDMTTDDGLMVMRRLDSLRIPVNGKVDFRSGGKHLMLIGPKSYVQAGEVIDMTLIFQSGIQQSVSVKVATN